MQVTNLMLLRALLGRRNRRMSKEYGFLPTSSETWIYVSMIRLTLKRLAYEHAQPAFRYRRSA